MLTMRGGGGGGGGVGEGGGGGREEPVSADRRLRVAKLQNLSHLFENEFVDTVGRVISAIHVKENRWQPFPSKSDRSGTWKNITKVVSDLENANIQILECMEKKVGCGDKTAFWWENWSGHGKLKEMFPQIFKIEKEKHCLVKDRIKQSGGSRTYIWKWRKDNLSAEEEIERACCELILEDASIAESKDKWEWKLEPQGEFSVKSIRRLWEGANLPELQYKHWWNNWVPLKVNFLGWRAVLNRLPSKTELLKRQVILSSYTCGRRKLAHTYSYIAHGQKEVWRGVERWCGIEMDNISSVEQLLTGTNQQHQTAKNKKIANAVFLVVLWSIWKARNDQNFNGKLVPPWRLIEEIKSQAYLWIKNRGSAGLTSWDTWSKFPFIVRKNPGTG
ncbi:hypothetical protein LXL04_033393 [Taraxacum kok-saghyz]